jgi:hypothetical protein
VSDAPTAVNVNVDPVSTLVLRERAIRAVLRAMERESNRHDAEAVARLSGALACLEAR